MLHLAILTILMHIWFEASDSVDTLLAAAVGVALQLKDCRAGGPKAYILLERPRTTGISEILFCRTLMFMWSFGLLD